MIKNFRRALVVAALSVASVQVLADDIQVYFNATVNAPAKQADLEQKMIDFIGTANSSVDIMVYDIDLVGIANAIVTAKNNGVVARLVTNNDNVGADNLPALNTLDAGGVPWIDDTADGSAGSGLQHNKLIVVDDRYVLFGSTNMTQSGIHGDLDVNGQLISNDNHIVIVDSTDLAQRVTTQMNYMWGDGPGGATDSQFGLTKPDDTLTSVYTTNDNVRIDVLFTPQSRSIYSG
jgi:phosphatidylserine/phosphatidylglycerophosphate/cardiolipin synthase-like enzyme